MEEVLLKIAYVLDLRRILSSAFLGFASKLLLPDNFILNSLIKTKSIDSWFIVFAFYWLLWYLILLVYEILIKKRKIYIDKQNVNAKIEEVRKRNEANLVSKYELIPKSCKDTLMYFIREDNNRIVDDIKSVEYNYFLNTGWILELPDDNRDSSVEYILRPEIYSELINLYKQKKVYVDLDK